MPVRTFIEAIRDGMAEEMRRDETVVVLGEDVGKKGGVFLATDGLWGEFGDDRVIDTPLTESMIVGASIGAAINGLRPVAEIQFADFIHPAFNQLVSEAARMRYRSNNGFSVPMVIRAPYGGGVHGALYHSQSVEAFFTHVPGLKVVIPSTPYDAKGLLRTAIRDDDPVLFFEHKKMYRSRPRRGARRRLHGAARARPRSAGPGRQVTVIAYGLMVAVRPRGRRAGRGGGDRRRGRRPPVAPAARPGHAAVVGAQDRQVPRRLRGQPVRRLRGGDRAIVAEEAFDYLDGPVTPDRRARRPGRAVQPRARGLVHAQPGEDRRRDPEARRVLMARRSRGPRRRRGPARSGCSTRTADRLEPATIYNLPTLRRPGREGPRLVRVREAGLEARQLLPAADRDLARPARRLLGRARSEAAPGEVGVQLRDARRGAVRASSRRSSRGRSSGTSGAPARQARRSRRRAPRARNTPIRAASRRSPPARPSSAAATGATSIASRPFFTSCVQVACHRAADDHAPG